MKEEERESVYYPKYLTHSIRYCNLLEQTQQTIKSECDTVNKCDFGVNISIVALGNIIGMRTNGHDIFLEGPPAPDT